MNNDPHAEPLEDKDRERLRASANRDYAECAIEFLALSAKCFRLAGLAYFAAGIEDVVPLLKSETEQALRDPTERMM